MLAERFDRLEDPTVEPDGMTARPQRDPVEVNGGGGR
jgi:hypothetical protein